jgi:hypothetical protein
MCLKNKIYKQVNSEPFSQFCVMSDRLQKFLPLLNKIKKFRPLKRQKIIEAADDDLILCLCECAKNTLNSSVPLNKNQFKRLGQHKKILRKLVNKKVPLNKKRKAILSQGGGFLLPLIAPILAAVVQGLIFK